MNPILYAANTQNFENLGEGVLHDCLTCRATEERNAGIELSLTYPVTGALADKLVYDAIIKAKTNDKSELQLFRIYKVDRVTSGIITVKAEHISYELSKNPVGNIEGTGTADAALTALLSGAAIPHSYTVESDVSGSRYYRVSFVSVRAGIKLIRDFFGGELEFDNRAIRLHAARGTDTGIYISRGKNLVSADDSTDTTGVYTAIFPYATDSDDNTITLPEKYLTTANSTKFSYIRALPVDLTNQFGEGESVTVANLREKARQYLSDNSLDTIERNIKISFVSLWQSPEYENIAALERVGICDIINVRDNVIGITAKAKVIKTVYDTLAERYTSIELGTARGDLSNAFTSVAERIKKAEKKADEAQKTAEAVNDSLKDYEKKSEVSASIEKYIDSEAGTAKIVSTCSGKFVTRDDLGTYTTSTEVKSIISQEITRDSGSIRAYVEGKNYMSMTDGDSRYTQRSELNAGIESYINTATGKAKIVSACSGTYVTNSDLSGYAKTSALTSIEQSISSTDAKIEMSSSYSKNTIGTNVYALLQLVSNPNSSSIKIKADKIELDGTLYMKTSDYLASGTTMINGAKIQTSSLYIQNLQTSSGDYILSYSGKILALGGGTTGSGRSFAEFTYIDMMVENGIRIGYGGYYCGFYYESAGFVLRPDKSSSSFDVGSSTCPIKNIYCKTLYVDSKQVGGSSDSKFESLQVGTSTYYWKIDESAIIPSSTTSLYFNIGSSSYPVQKIYAKEIYIDGTKVVVGSSTNTDFSGKETKLGGSSSYYIKATTANQLCPSTSSSYNAFYLGTPSYYWHYAYIGSTETHIGNSSSSKIGFFGKTAVSQKTVSSSATVATLISALKEYGLIA